MDEQDILDELRHCAYSNETLSLGPCPHRLSLVTRDPVPVFFVQMERKQVYPTQVDAYGLLKDAEQLVPGIGLPLLGLCRGISYRRLPVVVRTGIDVDPPDAPFFAEYITKAVEYGGWPKVLLVLDEDMTAPACLDLAADCDADLLESLKVDYPTMKSLGAGTIRLSRFPAGHHAVGSAEENAFGHWIPDNQKAALLAIVVLALKGSITADDVAAVVRASCPEGTAPG